MVYRPEEIKVPKDSVLISLGLSRLLQLACSSDMADVQALSMLYRSEEKRVQRHELWIQILTCAMENIFDKCRPKNHHFYFSNFYVYYDVVKLMVSTGKQPSSLAKFIPLMGHSDKFMIYLKAKEMDPVLIAHINLEIKQKILEDDCALSHIILYIKKLSPELQDLIYDRLEGIDAFRFINIYSDLKSIKNLDRERLKIITRKRCTKLTDFNEAVEWYLLLKDDELKKILKNRIRYLATCGHFSIDNYDKMLNFFSHEEIELYLRQAIEFSTEPDWKWNSYKDIFPAIYNDPNLRARVAKNTIVYLVDMYEHRLMSPKSMYNTIINSPLRDEILKCEDVTFYHILLLSLLDSIVLAYFWAQNPRLAYRHLLRSIKALNSEEQIIGALGFFSRQLSDNPRSLFKVRISRYCSALLAFKYKALWSYDALNNLSQLIISKDKSDKKFAKALLKKSLALKKEATSKRLYESVELIK